jgi:hypothetical protein
MVESRLRESRSKAEGDEQGGCEDGVTGRMTGELADEEMDAGRSGLPSKINGGPSTISEQDKQHDESGRDKKDRAGRFNVDLGILDDNQPGWIFLDVIARSGLYQSPSTDQSCSTRSSRFIISHANPRHFTLFFPTRTRLLSSLRSPPRTWRSGWLSPKLTRGMRTGRGVCMGFRQ